MERIGGRVECEDPGGGLTPNQVSPGLLFATLTAQRSGSSPAWQAGSGALRETDQQTKAQDL